MTSSGHIGTVPIAVTSKPGLKQIAFQHDDFRAVLAVGSGLDVDVGQRQRGSLSARVRHEGSVSLPDATGSPALKTASLLPNRFGVLSPLRTVIPMKLSIE